MKITYSNKISQVQDYPFATIEKKANMLKLQDSDTIDFGIGDPTKPTARFIISSLQQSAKKRASSGYPSYTGELYYRKSCASYLLREYGVNLNPHNEISSTIGSKEAIFHFPIGFINPGDTVICPSPSYPVYKTGTYFAGGIPYFVPLQETNDFLINFQKIPEDIAKKAKIIWTNYPNSPTGVTASYQWLLELVAWAKHYNIIIAADEGCYNDLYTKIKPNSILEITKKGVITFYSLSKRNNMTGYRVGFVAGDQEIIEGFRRTKVYIDSGTPTFIQDAACEALRDTSEISNLRSEYAEKRRIISEAFTYCGFPVTKSHSTFYLWQKCKNNSDGNQLSQQLLNLGIVVTPGYSMSDQTIDGINPGLEYVRFALTPDIKLVLEAAHRIKNAFRTI